MHGEVLAALADRREDDPAEAAVARAHFDDWLAGLTDEQRDAAVGFAAGLTNQQVGQQHGFGRGTGSNWRRELRQDWEEFERGERGR